MILSPGEAEIQSAPLSSSITSVHRLTTLPCSQQCSGREGFFTIKLHSCCILVKICSLPANLEIALCLSAYARIQVCGLIALCGRISPHVITCQSLLIERDVDRSCQSVLAPACVDVEVNFMFR